MVFLNQKKRKNFTGRKRKGGEGKKRYTLYPFYLYVMNVTSKGVETLRIFLDILLNEHHYIEEPCQNDEFDLFLMKWFVCVLFQKTIGRASEQKIPKTIFLTTNNRN